MTDNFNLKQFLRENRLLAPLKEDVEEEYPEITTTVDHTASSAKDARKRIVIPAGSKVRLLISKLPNENNLSQVEYNGEKYNVAADYFLSKYYFRSHRLYEKELDEAGNQESGLILKGRTTEDNTKIAEMIEDYELHAEWNAREGFWFFPEEEDLYDSLEKIIQDGLDEYDINGYIEGVFISEESMSLGQDAWVDDEGNLSGSKIEKLWRDTYVAPGGSLGAFVEALVKILDMPEDQAYALGKKYRDNYEANQEARRAAYRQAKSGGGVAGYKKPELTSNQRLKGEFTLKQLVKNGTDFIRFAAKNATSYQHFANMVNKKLKEKGTSLKDLETSENEGHKLAKHIVDEFWKTYGKKENQ